MPENPYEPPPAVRESGRAFPWGAVCLIALTVAIISLGALIANAQIREGGVTFLNAWLALSLLGLFCVGSTLFIVCATGWVFAALRRGRGPKPLRT